MNSVLSLNLSLSDSGQSDTHFMAKRGVSGKEGRLDPNAH